MFNNNNNYRFTAAITLVCVLVLMLSGCVSTKAVESRKKVLSELAPPVPVERPINAVLADFKKMVHAHVNSLGEREIAIEVEPIRDLSGAKEVPPDLNPWVREVISRIGNPLVAFDAVRASEIVRGPFATPTQTDTRPVAIYRISGSLRRASPIVEHGQDGRADVRAGPTDGGGTLENRSTVTSLTLALNVEQPNGLGIPAASSTFKIEIRKDELNRSLSFYILGNGLGGGRKVTLAQDVGEGLYDIAAAAVVQALGTALGVPYYRCGSMFTVDHALEQSHREALSRLTRAELERTVKRYLYVSGTEMDMGGPDLTAEDRAVIVLDMNRRSLAFSDRAALVEYAVQRWRDMDFRKGAEIVDKRMADLAVRRKEAQRKTEAEEAQWAISPVHFGWPAVARIVLLDLRKVPDPATRQRIIAAAGACAGCEDVAANPERTVAGVRLSSKQPVEPWEVQQALRVARLNIDLAWMGVRHPRLCILPK